MSSDLPGALTFDDDLVVDVWRRSCRRRGMSYAEKPQFSVYSTLFVKG
jgi:hypothetical protein